MKKRWPTMTERMFFRLTPEAKARLEQIAHREEIPPSELLRRVMERYLKKEEKKDG